MRPRLRAVARTGLLVVTPTLVACVALLEVGLRILGQSPSNVTDGIFQRAGATYRLRPNVTKVARTSSFSCTIATNQFGFRDRQPVARTLGPAPYDAFLGDSITFGNGVDYDDSFVGAYALQAAPRGIEVVNLAVGGHRLGDQAQVLEDFLAVAPRPPARVVVVFTKEFIAGFESDSSTVVVRNGYLYPRDRWIVPFLSVTLGDSSVAYGFFRDSIRRIQGRTALATRRNARDFLRDFSRTSPWARPEHVARFEQRLQALDRRIRDAGAAPAYAFVPVSRDLLAGEFLAAAGEAATGYDFLRFREIVRRHAQEGGIPFVDVTPALERLQASGEPVAFMQDPHYNARANQAVAGVLVAALLERAAR